MPLTHIVLINWNGAPDTVECIESLLRLDVGDFAVTVCDNGSTDGSIARLSEWFRQPECVAFKTPPWRDLPVFREHTLTGEIVERAAVQELPRARVTVLAAGENLGFAGGNNLGIRRALADPECRYIWLLNNDTVVTPNALTELLALMEQEKDVAICGSTLLFYHDPGVVQGLGGRFWKWRGRGSHLGFMRKADDLPSRAEIESQLSYVMGASMFIRREVFERVKGLSEDYFLYYEEPDLARSLLVSERQAWAPKSEIFHKEGASIGTSSVRKSSKTSTYYLSVNLLRYYRKHMVLLIPIAFIRLGKDCIDALFRRDYDFLCVVGGAVGDFLLGRRRKGPIGVAGIRKKLGRR